MNGISVEEFSREIDTDGWVVFPKVLDEGHTTALREDCMKWIDVCRTLQIAGGVNLDGDGTAHHAVGGNDSIDEFIDRHLFHDYLSHYVERRPYILHACNPVGGGPGAHTYVHKVHRDVATYIPNFRLRINMLVMLDDFTVENGATQVLRGSHRFPEKPSDDLFERQCEQIVGPSGTVVLFNSYLWHRGGFNHTQRHRVALTLSFGPAFIKPQVDYARMLGEVRGEQMSELTRQVLGYNARVAISREEWYRPAGKRLYRADQG